MRLSSAGTVVCRIDQGLVQTSIKGQYSDEAGACKITQRGRALQLVPTLLIHAQELVISAICEPLQESLGGQDMDEAGTSENGPRQPLHPLPSRASLADRLPPRPSELLKVYC